MRRVYQRRLNCANTYWVCGKNQKHSGLTVPQFPVVGCDAAGVSAQAVELGDIIIADLEAKRAALGI